MAGSAEPAAGRALAAAGAVGAVVVAVFLAWLLMLPRAAGPAAPVPAGYAAEPQPAAGVQPAAQSTPSQPTPTQPTTAPDRAGTVAPAGRAGAVVVDPAWLAGVAAGTGIPERALRAYAGASLALQASSPRCRLGWTTLAAIGAVESGHGSFGGAELTTAGTAVPAIVGPRLDGGEFAGIRDSDRGVLDGDPVWDRALGPMQFIPSTWDLYGRDADGDGTADPQDLDDAALSAGGYLCAAGGDLSTGAGWSAAIYAYNHSEEYVGSVRALADGYAAGGAGRR